jgi:hypothetical protein
MVCGNCKGINKRGQGVCCVCGKTWLGVMLYRWGEYFICSSCLKKEREK